MAVGFVNESFLAVVRVCFRTLQERRRAALEKDVSLSRENGKSHLEPVEWMERFIRAL